MSGAFTESVNGLEIQSKYCRTGAKCIQACFRDGRFPGVSDPGQANAIVRKGQFTYAQVKNIAQFGTIESLTYGAANGIRLAKTSMGISAVRVHPRTGPQRQ